MEFATSEWKPGDQIPQPPGPSLTVLEVVDGTGDELPILIVE